MNNFKDIKIIHIINIAEFIIILILFFILFNLNDNKEIKKTDNNIQISSWNLDIKNTSQTTNTNTLVNSHAITNIAKIPTIPQKTSSWQKDNCKTKDIEYTINWNSMEPLLKDKSKVNVIDNYYKCWWKVSLWDTIIYNGYILENQIIKKVMALPWDKIIIDDKTGEMKINWNILKNSKKETYKFDKNEVNFLKLYINNWVLQDWAYYIFWDNIYNSIDSRKFWAVSIEWFTWKVK
jgi:hypothetical protein